MASTVDIAKTKLTYPLFSADFDPEDDRYLLVGGGGGEGKTGVGNRITLLDIRAHGQISELAEIELSRDEDSVTSLAYAGRVGSNSAIALAGINSSAVAQQAGQNEHLRSFRVTYPADEESDEPARKSMSEKGSIQQLLQTSLFSPSSATKKETYQRVLRLSPVRKRGTRSRLGAIATGLAPEGEIVVFETSSDSIVDNVRGRITLKKGQEAADVDIIESKKDGGYLVGYCTDYEFSICEVVEQDGFARRPSSELESRYVYTTPHADAFSPGTSRPTFRALRFLTPSLVLLLSNKHGRSGAELVVLQYDKNLGEVILRKRLHSSMKAGIGLEVTRLGSDDDHPSQFVIAVAGQDISIELFTLNHTPSKGLGKLHHHAIYRKVHPLQMTKVCLSNFLSPAVESGNTAYLRLASVSMGNTVAVHHLPLNRVSAGAAGKPRYALANPPASSKVKLSLVSIVLAILIALLSRFLLGSSTQTGTSPDHAGAIIEKAPSPSPVVQDSVVEPLAPDHAAPPSVGHLLRSGVVGGGGDGQIQHVVITSDSTGLLGTRVHAKEESARKEGQKWEDLQEHEKEGWKRRLIEAGEWAAEEGETVLKGVFFGQLAEAVGHAVGG
ncbi:MAG: hypothetical protein M1816_001858 [Peltula sp. TS41687]|nr:MAG: hypothetical protein M1816_001858 [Peltula sp. TS41687]